MRAFDLMDQIRDLAKDLSVFVVDRPLAPEGYTVDALFAERATHLHPQTQRHVFSLHIGTLNKFLKPHRIKVEWIDPPAEEGKPKTPATLHFRKV